MTEDDVFKSDVDRWIVQALEAGLVDFGDVLRFLPGVDPSFVRARIEVAPEHVRSQVRWRVLDERFETLEPRLPVPHPLDFDWRFTRSTLNNLSDELVIGNSRLTLLGTPSLWMALHGRMSGDRLRLLDTNAVALTASLQPDTAKQVLAVDILKDPIPLVFSDIVVADPPWYPGALAGFVWVGSSLLRTHGVLLLSMPPLGTRPGVERERGELLSLTKSFGLTLRSVRTGALRYASPPFERAALRAAGLGEYVPNEWRQGDLVLFERTGDLVARRPVSQEKRWIERTIEGIRIRIDAGALSTSADPRLVSLVNNDVLPSVSRRDARRANVRVWTSGNRVFGCEAPARLVAILDDVIAERSHLRLEDRSTAESIRALVHRERTEYICPDGSG